MERERIADAEFKEAERNLHLDPHGTLREVLVNAFTKAVIETIHDKVAAMDPLPKVHRDWGFPPQEEYPGEFNGDSDG